MKTVETHARKLWIPYNEFRWPPPRLLQLLASYICKHEGHNYSNWRIETEDWFEHLNEPIVGAWHVCQRGCGTIQRVVA